MIRVLLRQIKYSNTISTIRNAFPSSIRHVCHSTYDTGVDIAKHWIQFKIQSGNFEYKKAPVLLYVGMSLISTNTWYAK